MGSSSMASPAAGCSTPLQPPLPRPPPRVALCLAPAGAAEEGEGPPPQPQPPPTAADLRALLRQWREYSGAQARLHDLSRASFRALDHGLALPAILLSTVAGTANIGVGATGGGLGADGRSWVTVAFGVMGLLSASLFAVHRYLRLPEMRQQHDMFSDEFAKLEGEVHLHTALHDVEAAPVGEMTPVTAYRNLGELAKQVKRSLDSLIDKAPPIPLRLQRAEAAAAAL